MKNTFTILSEDNPGVLMRIAGLIYRRGYNIESLSVGQTDTPGISRFTVVIEGEEGVYDQIRKQLLKLIESSRSPTSHSRTLRRALADTCEGPCTS